MTHHTWDHDNAKRIPSCETTDGNGRTERLCVNEGCDLVRITMHPPGGNKCWRRWRLKDREWNGERTPPCLGKPAPAKPRVASESTAEVIAR